eukprot:7386518-Prymnesium_polylepis.1
MAGGRCQILAGRQFARPRGTTWRRGLRGVGWRLGGRLVAAGAVRGRPWADGVDRLVGRTCGGAARGWAPHCADPNAAPPPLGRLRLGPPETRRAPSAILRAPARA